MGRVSNWGLSGEMGGGGEELGDRDREGDEAHIEGCCGCEGG